MSAFVQAPEAINRHVPFAILARRVFALNPSVQWVVLNELGSDACWAWRHPVTGDVCSRTAANTAETADLVAFMLAHDTDLAAGHRSIDSDRLLFLVLAYDDVVQILVPIGGTANLRVAVPAEIDAYAFARQILRLIEGCAPGPIVD